MKSTFNPSGFYGSFLNKSCISTGLKDSVKKDFPDVCLVVKPEFLPSTENLNGDRIAWFSQADGSFGLNIYDSPGMILWYSLQLAVRIVQHERYLIVLEKIINYWGFGKIFVKEVNQMYIKVTNLSHLVNILIPFYEQHSLCGAKHAYFLDLKKGGVTLVESKLSLTL